MTLKQHYASPAEGVVLVRFRPGTNGTKWICPSCKCENDGPKEGFANNIFEVMNAVYNNHITIRCSSCNQTMGLMNGSLPELLSAMDKDWGFRYHVILRRHGSAVELHFSA